MTAGHQAPLNCPETIIDDAPADEDAFGSHRPIADAIHEIVTTEDGGRTIGLEGSWGSGKSTVVELLKKRMEKSDSHHVVLFDAWAHQGDPLRRSFLENLITSLSDKSWLERKCIKNDWEKKRDELAGRRRNENTHHVTELGAGAIIGGVLSAAFTLFLSGAGVLLLADWMPWLGLSIYGLLCVILFVFTIWVFFFYRRRLKRTKQFNRKKQASARALVLIQSITAFKSTTIESPDPTSIEFEEIFGELMFDALERCPQRRLVLVIDNLDRVDPEDARSIWTTLQTFLHHPQEHGKAWLKRLWVVLPFDRSGIARLWGPQQSTSDEARYGETPINGDLNGGFDRPLAGSFIDKSIQVRFEVPRPLLSDWHSYLNSNLRRALPKCSDSDLFAAYRLYQIKTGPQGVPSPRELKQYVNRIGVLYRLWCVTEDYQDGKVAFSSLAYYASLNLPWDEVVQRLRDDKEFPPLVVRGLLEDNVEDQLAAIAFNVQLDRASQLLLDPLIDKALKSDTPDDLVALLDRTGFWEALPVTPIVQVGLGLQATLTAARRLLDIPEPIRSAEAWLDIRSQLRRHARESPVWPSLTTELADDLLMFRHFSSDEDTLYVVTRVSDSSFERAHAPTWAAGAHKLLSAIAQLEMRVPFDSSGICDMLATFGSLQHWESVAGRLKLDFGVTENLKNEIVARIAQNPAEVTVALRVLKHIEPALGWAAFVEDAASRLRAGAPSQGQTQQPSPEESRRLLEILWHAGEHGEQDRANLFEQGIAFEYVWHAHEQEVNEALGEWISEVLHYFSPDTWGTQSLGGYAPNGKQLVDSMVQDPSTGPADLLAKTIERMGNFELIDVLGSHTEGHPLTAALIARLWTSEPFKSSIEGKRFCALWPRIARAGKSEGLEISELMQDLCARAAFTADIKAQPFADDRLDMYTALINAQPGPDEAERFAEWVAGRLSRFTRDQWQRAMETQDEWATLLKAIHTAAPQARIAGQYAQALRKFLEKVVDGYEATGLETEQWDQSVIPLLEPSIKGAYEQGVIGVATSSAATLPEQFFALASDTLEEPRVFTRTEILDGLLPDLATEQNIAGLSWLRDALQDEGLRGSVPDGGFDALKEVIPSSLPQDPEDDPELDDLLRQLASLLGLELPFPPEPE